MIELRILAGVPGCGKSTYTKKYENDETVKVISSDDIRESIYGSLVDAHKGTKEEVKARHGVVFAEVEKQIRETSKEARESGENTCIVVILDATNLTRKSRRASYTKYAQATRNREAAVDTVHVVVFQETLKTLMERESQRYTTNSGKQVGRGTILRMYQTFDIPRIGFDCDSYEVVGTPFFSKDFDPAKVNKIQDVFPYAQNGLIEELKMLEVDHDCAPWHMETVDEHVNMCIALGKAIGKDMHTIGVFHDMGKGVAKKFNADSDKANYIDHEKIGAHMYLNYLTHNVDKITAREWTILEVIRQHMQAHRGFKTKYINKYQLSPKEVSKAMFFAENVDDVGRIRGEE